MMSCFFAFSLLAPSAAFAGFYQITQTGGAYTVPGPNGTPITQNYRSRSTSSFSGYGGASGGVFNPGCSGTITTTFTWQPNPDQNNTTDPPPLSVIVQEESEAVLIYPNGFPLTGSVCDNGIGGLVVSSPNQRRSYSKRYQIKGGGAQFTLICSPKATLMTPPGSEANVCYSATVFPVILTLSGTTKSSSSNDNILIGQGCTASLSAGPFILSNFQWNIPSETFSEFVMGTTQSTFLNPAHPYGRVKYLSPSAMTSPNPHWYWKKGVDFGDSQTISCTAQAAINGVSIGIVTGGKVVNVWRPYYTFAYNAGAITIFGSGTPDVAIQGNMNWIGRVGTPDLFRLSGNGAGIWQFTQFCALDRTLHPINPLITEQGIHTYGYLLDGEFNYSKVDRGPWAADSISLIDANGNAVIIGTEGVSGDVPTIGLDGVDTASVDDSFLLWLMYEPPGTDVQWVPLNLMSWKMNCDAYYNPLQDTYSLLVSPAFCQTQSNAPTSTFPEWEGVYAGTH